MQRTFPWSPGESVKGFMSYNWTTLYLQMWEKTGPTPARLDSRIEQYVKVFFS